MTDILLIAFLTLVGAAACEDLWRYRISNILCGALLLLFLVAAILGAWPVDWIAHLGAGALVFVVGLGIFSAQLMGGGDIKLLTVIALWAGLAVLPQLLFAICVASIVVVMLLLIVRALPTPGWAGNLRRPRFAERSAPVPFAVPVAAATLMCANLFPAFA